MRRLLPISLLLLLSVSFAVVEISDCGNLLTADETYVLIDNVGSPGNDCFTIYAPNITLDCRGFSILANNRQHGVYTTQFNSVIKNCHITGFEDSIHIDGAAKNVLIENNTLDSQNKYLPPEGGSFPI
jgi:hypothetical protein